MIIEVKDISFAYQNRKILENVNFSIKKGEFIGIFGPNGGGKTTLLKLLMGFLRPNSGSIKVFNKTPKEALSKIAYVPQSIHFDRLFPITVHEVVLSGRLSHLPWYGRYSQQDEDAAAIAMESMQLIHLKNQAFGCLSGGQAQRTLIARALVSSPKILLLDEPTASVDAKTESEIYKILDELKGKATILMVTHHLSTAINQVQRVLCVNKSVYELNKKDVCEHFTIGLYHPPISLESR